MRPLSASPPRFSAVAFCPKTPARGLRRRASGGEDPLQLAAFVSRRPPWHCSSLLGSRRELGHRGIGASPCRRRAQPSFGPFLFEPVALPARRRFGAIFAAAAASPASSSSVSQAILDTQKSPENVSLRMTSGACVASARACLHALVIIAPEACAALSSLSFLPARAYPLTRTPSCAAAHSTPRPVAHHIHRRR